MLFVGALGEGKWEKISWDQALDEIAAKLLEIRDKYGPEAVSLWNLPASVPPTYGMHNLMTARFRNVWGGTDPVYQYGIDDGPVYAAYNMYGKMPGMYFLTSPFNFDSSKLLIVWGANPAETGSAVGHPTHEPASSCTRLTLRFPYNFLATATELKAV